MFYSCRTRRVLEEILYPKHAEVVPFCWMCVERWLNQAHDAPGRKRSLDRDAIARLAIYALAKILRERHAIDLDALIAR